MVGERVVFWICDKICGYTGLFCENNVVSRSIMGLLELLNHIFLHKKACRRAQDDLNEKTNIP